MATKVTAITPELQKQYDALQAAIKAASDEVKKTMPESARNDPKELEKYQAPINEAHAKMKAFMEEHPGLRELIREARKEKKKTARMAAMNNPEAIKRREEARAKMKAWDAQQEELKKKRAADFAAKKKAKQTQKQPQKQRQKKGLHHHVLGFFAKLVKGKKKTIANKKLTQANKKAVQNANSTGKAPAATGMTNDTVLEILYLMVSTPEELENDKDEEELFELECQFVENGGDLEDLMYYN